MKNSGNVILLVFFLTLFANAGEVLPLSNDSLQTCEQEKPDYQKNLRTVAYLHPTSLFLGAAYNMFLFTSTIENPLSLGNSIIIQPTMWFGSSDLYIAELVNYENLRRLGMGIGIRQYATDKGSGFYLQAMAGAYYTYAESISIKEYNGDEDKNKYPLNKITTWRKVRSVLSEVMLYIGSAHKWQNVSFFYEAGLGFGYDGTDTFKIGYFNKLATNFNLGIGIPF